MYTPRKFCVDFKNLVETFFLSADYAHSFIDIMTFLLWSYCFACMYWNSLKICILVLLITNNVFQTFLIFCDFFRIQKYFFDSTDSKILKIEFYKSGSARKIWKKLFFNSPYQWVLTNPFLEFSELYLCFHMSFIKNIEKHWNEWIFKFLKITGKSNGGVLGS